MNGEGLPGGPVPRGLTAKVGFQWLSCVQLFATLWTTAHQVPLSFTVSQSLLKLTSTESLMLSTHLILCHPFSFCLQSFPALGSLISSSPLPGPGFHLWLGNKDPTSPAAWTKKKKGEQGLFSRSSSWVFLVDSVVFSQRQQFNNSVAQSCPTLRPHGLQHTRPPCPSPMNLLKLMCIESVMPSNHLIPKTCPSKTCECGLLWGKDLCQGYFGLRI